jgi:hypothetical protein
MPACYICGQDATTIDHVPPKGFFSALPGNVIELDACQQCNQSASLDEEYLRTAIAAQGYMYSAVAREVWEGAVKRSFVRRPEGLRARLAKDIVTVEVLTPEGAVTGRLPGINVDGSRALRVLKKIARGIYFEEQAKRLGEDELLLFRDGDVKMDFRLKTQNWPEVDMGEAFRYRSVHSPEGSMIWFEFYRFQWWLALTGNEAKTYPLKNR